MTDNLDDTVFALKQEIARLHSGVVRILELLDAKKVSDAHDIVSGVARGYCHKCRSRPCRCAEEEGN